MKTKKFINLLVPLMMLIFFATVSEAQVPSGYLCSIRNDSLVNSQVYEFDIYLVNTDQSKPFELDLFQTGILVNPAIVNGGTITASIISGSSQLVAVQQASAITFSASQNCIKLAPGGSAPHGSATIISTVTSGTRVARIRLTNTVPFGQFAPNFSFNFTAIPYNTYVFAKNQTYPNSSVNITSSANHSVSSMNNPVLNAPVIAFSMTGGGTDCNYTGLSVGLSSSESGVRYQLLKNAVPVGTYTLGTGSAFSFGLQTTGTYASKAYRKGTYLTQVMTGSVIVNNPSLVPIFTQLGPYCQGITPDVLPLTSVNGISGTWNSVVKTNNPGTTVYQFAPAAGQCAIPATMSIVVNPVYSFYESHSICAGSNYLWRGTNYTDAGTYHSNYVTTQNCDSTYTLILTINPVYAFTENHQICSGQTYNWHGKAYITDGTYYANYTSRNDCDSSYTLNLTVNPAYVFVENQSICEGQSYSWQGTNYTLGGTYHANYQTASGCDSTYTLILTVNPAYSFTDNQSICEGQSYSWQGSSYSLAGTYHVNYQTSLSCDSIYTLNLNVNPAYAYSENDTINNGETYTWHGTDYASAGTYHLNYSTAGGCDSTYTLHLIVSNSGSRILSLKLFLEGLYSGGGLMHEATDFDPISESFLPKWGSGIADTVMVVLYDDSYGGIVVKYPGVYLHTDGNLSISAIASSLNGSYYITIFQRNSVPITTATPQPFFGSTISYDFTYPKDQAYGAGFSSQKDLGDGFYGMYAGELDHDSDYMIDGSDVTILDPDLITGPYGYLKTDLNGDGLVDGSDMTIMDANIIFGPLFWNPTITKMKTYMFNPTK